MSTQPIAPALRPLLFNCCRNILCRRSVSYHGYAIQPSRLHISLPHLATTTLLLGAQSFPPP
jgi:hypothetical protein